MSEYTFKLAVCNELYEKTDFAAACRSLKKAGWQGIEIAPFTLRNDATTLPAERRKEVRNIIQSEGLEFVGLHWLTVGPTGLHVTTPDEAMRKHSWDFVRRLVDLCADLRQGDSGGVMVFGSPMQRKSTGGLSPQQATTHFIDGVRSITGHLEDLGVTLLVEALPSEQCDVIGSLDEAIEVVRAVNSPAVRSMFDSHNANGYEDSHLIVVDFREVIEIHRGQESLFLVQVTSRVKGLTKQQFDVRDRFNPIPLFRIQFSLTVNHADVGVRAGFHLQEFPDFWIGL